MRKSTTASKYKLLKLSGKIAVTLAALMLLAGTLLATKSYAGSATWRLSPASSDWNTRANWMPHTVPDGPADTATFSSSNVTAISLSARTILDGIVYEAGASAFTINVSSPTTLTFTGAGITNNSGVVQNFATNVENMDMSGVISFTNSATAGSMTVFTNNASPQQFEDGGVTMFSDNASAGSALIINNGAPPEVSLSGGRTEFHGNSTAANGVFINNPNAFAGGFMQFFDSANAGNGSFTCFGGMENAAGGSTVFFNHNSSAANGTFLIYGPTAAGGVEGSVVFNDSTTADHGTFTASGGTVSPEQGGAIIFFDSSTAADGTFVIEGTSVSGAEGGSLFFGDSSAGNATIILNGGEAAGGECSFSGDADGGTARLEVFGNSTVFILTNTHPFRLGSIEGDGLISTAKTLEIGGNNLSTVFSGVIDAGGNSPVEKVGTGTLTLSGANTYTGGTVIIEGGLKVDNTTGSGTGTGPVAVDGSILGGKGIIAGTVTVGTGSGTGAFLEPSIDANRATALTIQSGLTFKADGTYTYKLNTKRARADQVIANGATIESGAQFSFTPVANKRLTAGTVFTAISNTSANPITGIFANLPDGSIFTVGRNNYQVSYSGGDGNDLTLTVVP